MDSAYTLIELLEVYYNDEQLNVERIEKDVEMSS